MDNGGALPVDNRPRTSRSRPGVGCRPGVERQALVLSCRGQAVTSTGVEDIPILLKMTVDADSDYFVEYQGL